MSDKKPFEIAREALKQITARNPAQGKLRQMLATFIARLSRMTETRLRRELTKRFFLVAGNEKILITFSAGVAQLTQDESGADAIKRADQAMYLAKRAGKNRVIGA